MYHQTEYFISTNLVPASYNFIYDEGYHRASFVLPRNFSLVAFHCLVIACPAEVVLFITKMLLCCCRPCHQPHVHPHQCRWHYRSDSYLCRCIQSCVLGWSGRIFCHRLSNEAPSWSDLGTFLTSMTIVTVGGKSATDAKLRCQPLTVTLRENVYQSRAIVKLGLWCFLALWSSRLWLCLKKLWLSVWKL